MNHEENKYYSTNQRQGSTNTWLTPRSILDALGEFDLDPCATISMPEWVGAKTFLTENENGMERAWTGRVFMNPPYGRSWAKVYKIDDWMNKLSTHGNGIALVFARMDTRWWNKHVWSRADAVLFLHKRVCFCDEQGRPSGAGIMTSALVAYGENNATVLKDCTLKGQFFYLNRETFRQEGRENGTVEGRNLARLRGEN